MASAAHEAVPATDLPGWRVVAPGSLTWSATARAMLRLRPAGARQTKEEVRRDPSAAP
mgnify:CR=1 FL=1